MNILITRSARFKVFGDALAKVRSQFPDAKIHVLIQKSALDSLEAYGDDLLPIQVQDGPFGFRIESIRLLMKLRKKRFDAIILVYSNADGNGYLNFDLMSLFSGIEKEMVYDNEGNFYPVRSRLKKIAIKSLYSLAGWTLYGVMRLQIGLRKSPLNLEKNSIKTGRVKSANRAAIPELSENTSLGSGKEKSSKKRIVFVDLMFTWPPHGGACVDIKEIAERLMRRGYDVHFIVPKFPGIFPRGDVDQSMLPFTVHKIDFSMTTFNMFFLPGKIKKEVDKLKPDIVYLGDSYFLKPYIIEALKAYRIIARFYTYELLCPNYYLLYKNGKRCDVNYLSNPAHCLRCAVSGMSERIKSLSWDVWSHEFIMGLAFFPSYHRRAIKAISLCDTLITYNDIATKMLSKFHPNVITFPGGVNASDFVPGGGSTNGVKKIFVSGRLVDPRKGLKFFVDTVRKLREHRKDFEIYLTHDQDFKEDYITSLGWIDHGKIREIYRGMDLCVVPSLWAEPFGMVAVEAMAAGKPVVASDTGGLKVSVDDGVTGLLFPPGDSRGLNKCLNRLLDDPSLMKQMGEAGRDRVVRYFEWDRVVDKYCREIIERV